MKDMPEPTIDWREMGKGEVSFSWDDPESNQTYHFAVERLEKYLIKIDHPVVAVQVDPVFGESLLIERGLESHRIARLLEAPEKWTPVIVLQMPDGSGLLVDGNHRYYITYKAGVTKVPAYFVAIGIWKKFLIKFPFKMPASNIGWSGIA